MPVSLIKTTSNNYEDFEIGPNEQLSAVQFAVSAPYSCKYQIATLNSTQRRAEWVGTDLVGQPGQGGYTNIYGIRFKSFDPANPTTVLVNAYFPDDPIPTGSTPSSSIFTPSGSVTTQVWLTGDYKQSVLNASHADPNGGFWLLCNGGAIPTQYASLIALIGANTPDAQGRGLWMLGTNADVHVLFEQDPYVVGQRSPVHLTSPGTFGTPFNNDGSTSGDGRVVTTDHGPVGDIAIEGVGGPGGTRPTDMVSYIVIGNLFIHT